MPLYVAMPPLPLPLELKEANIIPLFKKGSRNKSVNYRPVSLTSVICKVLETIIRDHMMDVLIVLKANTTHDSPVKFHGLFSVHPFARGRAKSIQYNTVQVRQVAPPFLDCHSKSVV